MTSPTTAFDISIPIKVTQGKATSYFYIGYTTKDPTTGVVKLAYISARKTISHTGSAPTASGTYGPVLTGVNLGQTLASMQLRAQYSGVSTNSGDNVGGAFLYFSEWDYFGTTQGSAITGWGLGNCHVLGYLLYSTNYDAYLTGSTFTYTYKDMKGVICYADTGSATSSITLAVPNSKVPSLWGLVLPGYGAYSQNTGLILDKKINSMNVPASLAIADVTTIKTPTMGPSLVKSIGKWIIPLPVAL